MISYRAAQYLPGPSSQPDNESHHRLIAQHYSARRNCTVEEREASPIIHLKKLHNWIKAVLIGMHVRRGNSVLDVACGKGGDLAKWQKAEVKQYVGVDVVESSLQQAWKRYTELKGVNGGFAATFICADCFAESMRALVAGHAPLGGFDICSCQFALHYSWSSMARARAALANVAALLKPGGHFIGTMPDADVILSKLRKTTSGEFGNKLYKVTFDKHQKANALRCAKEPFGLQYEFHLEDAVNHCPEWLVSFNELKNLAQQYGLELVLKKNFHEFVNEHKQGHDLAGLMHKLGAHGTISPDEWDCVSIYLVFVFRKKPNL